MNFIVPQIPEVELAKMMHEAAREVVIKGLVVRRDVPNNGFIEWDQLDDAAREGRLIQARFLLAHYSIAHPYAVAELDESLDCARRDCSDAQQKLRKCHTAMVGVVGVETDEALKEMRGTLHALSQFPGVAGVQAAKEIAPLILMIDTLTDTGYRNDGTCAGDAAKCCGNCGDEGVKGGPSEPPATDEAGDALETSWGPL